MKKFRVMGFPPGWAPQTPWPYPRRSRKRDRPTETQSFQPLVKRL